MEALVLVPTELELERFRAPGELPTQLGVCQLAGFGPVAAAARTAMLLAHFKPKRVLLVGIAGAFDAARHSLGSAQLFSRVHIDGIGAGQGSWFRAASQLGFPHWPAADGRAAIGECLPLSLPRSLTEGQPAGELLSVCSASNTPGEGAERKSRFPGAVAEDMEGFGVALACALARTPLAIVRGISNQVGERDARRWEIAAAMTAARQLSLELLRAGVWVEQT